MHGQGRAGHAQRQATRALDGTSEAYEYFVLVAGRWSAKVATQFAVDGAKYSDPAPEMLQNFRVAAWRWSAKVATQFTVDGAKYSDPSPETLQRSTSGKGSVTVAVNVSRADYDTSRFGNSLVSLLYDTEDKMGFAVARVTCELLLPLRGLQRHQAPLFTPGGVKPWAGSKIDGKLKAVMVATLTPRHRVGKTPHTKRVWVAKAGRALQASDARIQAFVH